MVFMQKIIKSPFIIAAVICFAIAGLMLFKSDVAKPSVKAVKTKAPLITITPSPTKAEESAYRQAAFVTLAPTMVPASSQAPSNTQSNPTAAPTQQPTSMPAMQTLQVNLSINGTSVGSVTVDQGANQCDVLTKARDQGKISSLLMKYDSSLGTNGVYQINGQGKENSVWWVYKVNGQSPGQGCSLVKVNSGENIEWSYIGQ